MILPSAPQWLTPPQQLVLDAGLMTSGFNCVLQMPTGSGKTWLAEHAIAQVLEASRRAVYLAPLRALATELHGRWEARFGGDRVGVFTGDPGHRGRFNYSASRLLVMTPERLDACTRAWRTHWRWLPEVDLLVVDELHLLGDRGRGPRLEGAISRFRRLNPFARVLGLSATLGNRAELARWLDGIHFASTWRPIPIAWRVVHFRKASEKPELAGAAVGTVVRQGGRSLIFVQSRRRAEDLAAFLRSTGLAAAHHHAGLDQAARRDVESKLHSGAVDVVVATSTVEMGVNLPVRQVVLYDLQAFDGAEFRPLSVNTVWQRVGRAGRPGLDMQGEGVLLSPAWERRAREYADSPFDPIRSGLADGAALAEQVVAEVASGLARTRSQLTRVMTRSLAHLQGAQIPVSKVADQMLAAGMLREGPSATTAPAVAPGLALRVTRLGRIAVRHLLAPATVLLFRRVLDTWPDLTFFDLLLAICCTDDIEPVLPVGYEELTSLHEQLSIESSVVLAGGAGEPSTLLCCGGKRLLSALRMALALRSWTRTGDIEAVAQAHNCYPYECRRLVDNAVRLLRALTEVGAWRAAESATEQGAVRPGPPACTTSGHERICAMLRMVEAGLDESAATLTLVRGIGPRHARQLVNADVADIEDLANADAADLLPLLSGVSLARLERWIGAAGDNVKEFSAFRYREAFPTVGTPTIPLQGAASIGTDPYRLRRAQELSVARLTETSWQITGGLEPHQVIRREGILVCDCMDAGRGNTCKHLIAVRLAEYALTVASRTEAGHWNSGGLDLTSLWMGSWSSAAKEAL